MSAVEFARRVPDGGAVRWKALELAAYEGAPRLQLILDPARKYGQYKGGLSRDVTAKKRLGVAFIVVPGILLAFAPVAGFVLLFRTVYGPGWAEHTSASADVAAAAVVFAADAVYLIVIVLLWQLSGRFRFLMAGLIRWQSRVAIGLGLASFIVAAVRGAQASVPGWQFWTLPILVTVVVAAIQLVLLRREPTAADANGGLGSKAPGSPTRGEREAPRAIFLDEFDRLPPEKRTAIADDLASAIAVLEERGLISSQQADWAREARMGALARHMSQPRRLR